MHSNFFQRLSAFGCVIYVGPRPAPPSGPGFPGKALGSEPLLREILGAELGTSPESLCFARSSRGKPFLVQPRFPLWFSVSHTRGWLAVACSRGGEVGIDIEEKTRRFPSRSAQRGDSPPLLNGRSDSEAGSEVPRALTLARRFFLPQEARWVAQALGDPRSEDLVTERFLRLWTQKEALAKCSGEGLSAWLAKPIPRNSSAPLDLGILERWPTELHGSLALAHPEVPPVESEKVPR